jgi:hypothetical protein
LNYLIYILIFTTFFAEYLLSAVGIRSKLFSILPEIISMITGVYLLIYFALKGTVQIQGRYLWLFLAVSLHFIIGLIGNQVQPLAIFSGLRNYLKYLPFYLLPMVYIQSNEQIERIVKILLGISLLQCPLALYQRFFQYTTQSGDLIAGTLGYAPHLTIFMTCTISLLISFYMKKRIGTNAFLVFLICVFLPTTINETKSTVIFLPCAILIPTLFEVRKESRMKILLIVIPIFIVFIFGFSYMYKVFYGRRAGIGEFFTSDKVSSYLYKGSEKDRVSGEEGSVGRIDSILLAYNEFSGNLFRMVWGVGIGNAVLPFSRKFEGKYTREYLRLGGKMTGIAHIMWETGLLGVVYGLLFLSFIFSDALILRKQDTIIGPIALGWLGVTIIMIMTLPYQNIIAKDALVYMFLFFSGHLSAMRNMIKKT